MFEGIRAFANSHSDSDLTTGTDSYIQANLDQVLQCPERCQLPNIQMKIIGESLSPSCHVCDTGRACVRECVRAYVLHTYVCVTLCM